MLNVKVYPDLYSPHITQVYSGLYDLAKEGKIGLEFTGKVENSIKKAARNSVLCLQVSDSETDLVRTVCFDMFDGCEMSSVERLKISDVYIKRSYYDKYIENLDTSDRKKIIPYGLNYECRSRNERDILKRLFLLHSADKSFFKNPYVVLRHFSIEVVKHLMLRFDVGPFGLKPMSVTEFVVRPDKPAEPKILFQTRLWTSLDCPRISEGDLKEINDNRVNTIRSLKAKFGKQFVGGLVPTDFAKNNYPECCLSSKETNRKNYLKCVKECLICVTTAGLHDSIGFKFPEYLAASRCIVTEPLKFQLPVSLIEGKHYLSFRKPEECVEACEKLLADTQLANRMRQENYDYYLTEMEPSALVYKRLKAAMDL